jgi:outer membrane protein assembly factor BamE (lipoprotein component of BamABCDE complex)
MSAARLPATAALLAAMLSGCAATGNGRIATLTQDRATAGIVPGQTTMDDVRRTFGDATVTVFPDGREVWFYRYEGGAARLVKYVPLVGRMAATGSTIRELRILFGRDGRVRKFKLQDIRLQ